MNTLFPVFLKADHLRFLIAGSGETALEKYHTLRKNSTKASITIYGVDPEPWIRLQESDQLMKFFKKNPTEEDLSSFDIVIAATRDKIFNTKLKEVSKRQGILFNAADMPDLCDFHLASTLQKGNLKIAVSTNGISPSLGIELKKILEDCLPEDLDLVALELNRIRDDLKRKMKEPKEKLKEITSALF